VVIVGLIVAAVSIPFSILSKRRSRPSFKCFVTLEELQEAVDRFVGNNETDLRKLNNIYGRPMSNWCVSRVGNFSHLFSANWTSAMATFNEPLDGWDTSNVTDMSYMFYDAAAFNQNVSHFDVSRVTTMASMF